MKHAIGQAIVPRHSNAFKQGSNIYSAFSAELTVASKIKYFEVYAFEDFNLEIKIRQMAAHCGRNTGITCREYVVANEKQSEGIAAINANLKQGYNKIPIGQSLENTVFAIGYFYNIRIVRKGERNAKRRH